MRCTKQEFTDWQAPEDKHRCRNFQLPASSVAERFTAGRRSLYSRVRITDFLSSPATIAILPPFKLPGPVHPLFPSVHLIKYCIHR